MTDSSERNFEMPERIDIAEGDVQYKYVAFCDVLGFSNEVMSDFDAASKVYVDFINSVRTMQNIGTAEVVVYSDSILVTGDDLFSVLQAVNLLWWSALLNDWMLRGGVAYGRVWTRREGTHLFVVSEPLVKAAQIEKSVRVPAVALAKDIEIPEEAWVHRFSAGALSTPLLHFGGLNIVNPFNSFWFQSAITRVSQLLERFPMHSDKYYWFLALTGEVNVDAPLVPPAVLKSLQEQGVIEFIPHGSEGEALGDTEQPPEDALGDSPHQT